MRKLFVVLFGLVAMFVYCNPAHAWNTNKVTAHNYDITVLQKNEVLPRATVMGITESGNEVLLQCDRKGYVQYETNERVVLFVGMSLGLSGVVEVSTDGEINIPVSRVDLGGGMQAIASIGTFGVYSTDGNGDVSFKYQGAFQGYYCINYLPPLGTGENGPNPNSWNGWDLTNWLPTWKGKKLLVPTRYQDYHTLVYGYSISNALKLMVLI